MFGEQPLVYIAKTMSSFSENNLVKKLSELNGTQQSIQTLSLWLIHHRKHSKMIVQMWLRALRKASPQRRLVLIYLANDVIQNSKKKGPEFTKEFGSILTDAFALGYKDAPEKQKNSLDRILSIWEERGVYSKDFMNSVKQTSGNVAPLSEKTMSMELLSWTSSVKKEEPEPTPVTVASVLTDTSSMVPKKKRRKEEPSDQASLRQEVDAMKPEDLGHVDTESLVKRLSALENSASCDAAIREQIAKLPPEVSDISQLAKLHDKDSARKLSNTVDNACVLLTDYNRRLNEELDERRNVAKLLRAFIVSQTDHLHHTERRLQDYKNKLAKIKMVRNELKSHIQNLPDIAGGLAPLPAVNDLFH